MKERSIRRRQRGRLLYAEVLAGVDGREARWGSNHERPASERERNSFHLFDVSIARKLARAKARELPSITHFSDDSGGGFDREMRMPKRKLYR